MIEGLIALAGIVLAAWLVMREAYPVTVPHPEAEPVALPPPPPTEALIAAAVLFNAVHAPAPEPVRAGVAAAPPVAVRRQIAIVEDLRLDEVLAAAAEDAPPPRHATLRLGTAITGLALLAAGAMWVVVRGFVSLFDKLLKP